MARKEEPMRKDHGGSTDKSRMKVRFLEFELEGDNNSLQESLRTITAAVTQVGPRVQSRLLVNGKPVGNGKAADAVVPPIEEEMEEDASQTAFDLSSTEEDVVQTDNTSPKPVKPRGPRRIQTPAVLPLDVESGPLSLRDFVAAKKPDDEHFQRYLVIAAWFSEHRKQAAVSASHAYTCYKLLGWVPPDDPYQPLRDMQRKKQWFNKGAASGEWEINVVGLNQVARMGEKVNGS
jgi:hypothetical protein